MAEMLQSLQDEKEEKDGSTSSKGAEKVVNVVIGKPIDGTIVTVDDEQYITADEADAKRPKPVPKKNRRGNKELMAELDRTKELAEGNVFDLTMNVPAIPENDVIQIFGIYPWLETLVPQLILGIVFLVTFLVAHYRGKMDALRAELSAKNGRGEA